VAGGLAALAAAAGGMVAVPAGGNDGNVGGGDARTLAVKKDTDGNPYRTFKDWTLAVEESDLDGFPIPGPRTVKSCSRQVADFAGGSPTAHSHLWRQACKFSITDYPAVEHMEWSKAWEAAACYDQVDGANLACVELIVRNIQRIEERYKDKVLATWDDMPGGVSLQFTSSSSAWQGGLVIDPRLSKYFNDINHSRFASMKEERKAREEREIQRKNKKGKKDAKDDG